MSGGESPPSGLGLRLSSRQHSRYLRFCLASLPGKFCSLDSSRLTIAFFAISGLDLLGHNPKDHPTQRDALLKWLYSLQVKTDGVQEHHRGGFQGSTTLLFKGLDSSLPMWGHRTGHVAMTYTGLATLLILGDDLSGVDRLASLNGTRALQMPDGSFRSTLSGGESDMRFVYCAACVCYILDDFQTGMDCDAAEQYILNSITYEGGVAQAPGLEAHGGSTFCAVATLFLMGRLESALSKTQLSRLILWCVRRQQDGFQGRPNKPQDTCYSFWVGATLKLLGTYDLVHGDSNREYVLSTQDPITGGLAKWEGCDPDPLHTYLGLSGLALLGRDDGLKEVHPALNISAEAAGRLDHIHQRWRLSK